MIKAIKFFLPALLLLTILGISLLNHEVLFESRESLSRDGGPIFNRVRHLSLAGKEVWMMNQSHHGLHAAAGAWDRLAIVIDQTKSPQTAQFYELEPGPLEWREGIPQRPFHVSCLMCHNNGPRALRPNFNSLYVDVGMIDRLQIYWWNLKIKSYGRIVTDPSREKLDQIVAVPFRLQSDYENETLKVATCLICHDESGIIARGRLLRQQSNTIRFLIENGQMPPFPFSLSTAEKAQLAHFLEGF